MIVRSPTDSSGIPPAIREAAAAWRSRCDAGLDAAQEDEFIAWLDADTRHAIAYGEIQEAFATLLHLQQARPAVGAPDPDLFARPASAVVAGRGRVLRTVIPWGLAAAALLALGLWLGAGRGRAPEMAQAGPAVEPRWLDLPDGSVVELNRESRVEVQFSPAERRLRLVKGEAYFTVAKNPERPFVVEAHGIAVRAVGTAFNVHLQTENVAVLVTEGQVTVSSPAAPPSTGAAAAPALDSELFLEVGNRVTIPIAMAAPTTPVRPAIETLPPASVEQALAWRDRLLEFMDAPLAEVVAEFNRYNRHQLVIADTTLARQRFGGTFRPDAYEAVVRLLETDFEVAVERREGRTILRRRRE